MCYQSTMKGNRVLKRNAYFGTEGSGGFLVMGECRANRQQIWPSLGTKHLINFYMLKKKKGKKCQDLFIFFKKELCIITTHCNTTVWLKKHRYVFEHICVRHVVCTDTPPKM